MKCWASRCPGDISLFPSMQGCSGCPSVMASSDCAVGPDWPPRKPRGRACASPAQVSPLAWQRARVCLLSTAKLWWGILRQDGESSPSCVTWGFCLNIWLQTFQQLIKFQTKTGNWHPALQLCQVGTPPSCARTSKTKTFYSLTSDSPNFCHFQELSACYSYKF